MRSLLQRFIQMQLVAVQGNVASYTSEMMRSEIVGCSGERTHYRRNL
jgi:hypothetical protein